MNMRIIEIYGQDLHDLKVTLAPYTILHIFKKAHSHKHNYHKELLSHVIGKLF